MKHQTQTKGGFTLIEIMIVVTIIGMLASIAIPAYAKARQKAQMAICVNNLRVIEGAVDAWAVEARKQAGETVQYADISGYLKHSVICPCGGKSFDDSYQLSGVDAPPVCLRVTSGEYAHRLAL